MTDTDPPMLASLTRAYARLPNLHADIFSAISFDQRSYAEIADRTGYTTRQVECIFADALARLNRDIDEQERGDSPGALRRFVRDRCRAVRLAIRLWRGRV